MANYAYMTIEGKSQGLISEGCSTLESIGNRYQAGHTDEIMILAFNHMMSNDGHAVHNPSCNKIVDVLVYIDSKFT